MSVIQWQHCFWNNEPIVISAKERQKLLPLWLKATTAEDLGFCNILQRIRRLELPSPPPPLGLGVGKSMYAFQILYPSWYWFLIKTSFLEPLGTRIVHWFSLGTAALISVGGTGGPTKANQNFPPSSSTITVSAFIARVFIAR